MLSYILALLAAATPATAQQPESFDWQQNGISAPADASRASQGSFGVMLVTSDIEGFWRAGEGATPPQVTTTDRVASDQPVHGMLLFAGCAPDPQGNCSVTTTLSMTGPTGAPYGEPMTATLWNGPPPGGHNLQLSQASLGFRLEPEDALGVYMLRATVRDNVAGTTLSIQQGVTDTAAC